MGAAERGTAPRVTITQPADGERFAFPTTLDRQRHCGWTRPALRVLPVSVLAGPRQTGKTTLARLVEPSRAYFTLDEMGVLDQAPQNPNSLLAMRPVVLDEVQRAPQLLLAVKRAVDERRRAGDFILTGSVNLLLMEKVADTLAGRAIYLERPPFCPTEWQERLDAFALLDQLFSPDFDRRQWPDEPGDWPGWLLVRRVSASLADRLGSPPEPVVCGIRANSLGTRVKAINLTSSNRERK